jgi:transcriptional regulator with XRE-family HTH domain
MTPEEFKAARQSFGLTQAEFAKLVGYEGKRGSQVISDIERGRSALNETVSRLVQAYLDGWRPDDWPEKDKS